MLRDAKPSTRIGRAAALTVFFKFLELRHQVELHNLTGRVVECPLDEINRPRASVDPQLRIPPTAAEIEQLFTGWRTELVTCRKFAPVARNYAVARLAADVGLRINEARMLDLDDVRWELGRFGKLNVRHGAVAAAGRLCRDAPAGHRRTGGHDRRHRADRHGGRANRARHHAGTRGDHTVPQPAAHHRRPVETTAAAPGPAGTPSASSSPGPSPTASATGSPAPPPFSVTAEASTRCGGTVPAPTFYLVVTATVTGGTFASADLYWSVPRASRPQWMSMTLSGTTSHARVDRIADTTVTWWVNAVSDTGEKVSTGMTATTVDCPAGG